MKRLVIAIAAAALATTALANPVPVTNTTKRPYKESKVYCNDAVLVKPSKGENIACYNHDACYSDPQGRSRMDCDEGYLRDMRLAGLETTGYIKFKALRNWGKTAWERCRENDKRQAAK
ncbi:hypothetical protein JJB09_11190 [Rhizobium sp. KVB221]|uniref:Uncharacterized protein n=1 Tax=Rhizobium setariae TaxID=2801340 RepID=A0A937CPJ3_9HYPH|nr:hypothetical protein [Rhizobium setariae]MBL0372593.1 hypothetical protein [Rhizobium setariae]